MPSNTVFDQKKRKRKKREGAKETRRGVQELFYENRGDRRASEKERVRQAQRGGVADGDMLIYEPRGFSLTILRFTETERGGEKERQTERGKTGEH